MPIEPAKMHAAIAEICRRYGMQYWIWMPATVDLEDNDARSELLDVFEETFAGTQYLTGVFVPRRGPWRSHPAPHAAVSATMHL